MTNSTSRRIAFGILGLVSVSFPASAAEWKPKQAPLMTRWAKDVDPAKTLPDYPRPQMRREKWQNLNGLWDYAIRPKDESSPRNSTARFLSPSRRSRPSRESCGGWSRQQALVPADV